MGLVWGRSPASNPAGPDYGACGNTLPQLAGGTRRISSGSGRVGDTACQLASMAHGSSGAGRRSLCRKGIQESWSPTSLAEAEVWLTLWVAMGLPVFATWAAAALPPRFWIGWFTRSRGAFFAGAAFGLIVDLFGVLPKCYGGHFSA
jgi:hypothetical protein